MLEIGVQTKEAVSDENPQAGFEMLREAGFACVDFSLNGYLLNTDIYENRLNRFFDASIAELESFFAPHKAGAQKAGIRIHQMHMPYPIYVPSGTREVNEYLWQKMAPKSMELCAYLGCHYIVIHGFKLARELGREDLEWAQTEKFIHYLAPMAKEMGITLCVENLYTSLGGHMVEGPCCNARKAAERIERINEQYGAEVLGFCFDTGHANLVGLDMEEFITTLGPGLKVLHIHDNDGITDLHQVPYTFARTRENTSSTDWAGFLRGLRNIKYRGVLNFETAPVLTAFPREMHLETLKFIARIGAYWSKEIVQ
ncbi:Sugar phosphate isomerase/epimerase [Selenomonas ruminantium]|uniref:Sugar phosphate isomerase/epimerase n=1 Tax=Selenomonas ruminantium TaxID=971 RepID=A0A1M6UQJ2_SELRU|nr:sugar phosphate isomerase/epimerase [Selenomonas ruminantium]SHK71445.1 Sugar phosphate isomerase/epimerase [Selenomonas ruminantium]